MKANRPNALNLPLANPPDRPLRFGIPSLDRLFYTQGATKPDAGIELRPEKSVRDHQVSMCIIGPSGTGKSILGLHLASRYWADSGLWEDARTLQSEKGKAKGNALQPPAFYPSVVYISTDLGIDRAKETWEKFRLGRPNKRSLPFNEGLQFSPPKKARNFSHEDPQSWKVGLDAFDSRSGTRLEGIARYLTDTKRDMPEGKVAFVDLAETTAGDDWGYVSRLVKQLPTPDKQQPLHMIIIDAVEGLEMLVGETDAYGQLRSRRSRVAQILRAASKKCHVVMILEEDDAHQHPAEEYVTDIVMRLRVAHEGDYLRRSLEVVKSRGHPLIRGEHNYVIRGGGRGIKPSGGHTTTQNNDLPEIYPDDPSCNFSYFQLIRSLHSLSRVVMWNERALSILPISSGHDPALALMTTPKFGYILPQKQIVQPEPRRKVSGLIRGRTTSLIGDEATLKSRLGRAFLAGAFDPDITSIYPEPEASVLITTFNLGRAELAERLSLHWTSREGMDNVQLMAAMKRTEKLFIYRQLEVHHLNSCLLFHIIRRCVEHALERLEAFESAVQPRTGNSDKSKDKTEKERLWWERSVRGPRIRVVIDDWNVLQKMYPAVANDSLFLPFLIRYFEAVGVTAMIISTQPGRPEEILSGNAEQTLRALSHYHLYTWHVPFYGSDRVAIAAVPAVEGARAVVDELRPPNAQNVSGADKVLFAQIRSERLWIDPHFELYMGLERKEPQPVPLEVYLFSAAAGFEQYATTMNGLLNRLFTSKTGDHVIVPQDRDDYASLRDFCSLHGGTYRDHTLVIQVDEYWRENKVLEQDDDSYLEQRTYYRDGDYQAETNDPYGLYQPPRHFAEIGGDASNKPQQKHAFFEPSGYSKMGDPWWCDMKQVPYLWDFGFLLLRKNAWEGAMKFLEDTRDQNLVKRVWYSLVNHYSPPNKTEHTRLQLNQHVRWREFFEACRKVAIWYERPHRDPFSPFELDLISPQSFSCLVLEVWASELRLMGITSSEAFPHFRNKSGSSEDPGLDELLSDSDARRPFRLALFRAWILIASVTDPKSILNDQHRFKIRPAPLNTVATRHWYSTGSLVWKEVGPDNPVIHARLPGCASTRGDWFLMVGRESRSRRLGERAIDLLCRRRTNIDRLELGLGLPVRKLLRCAWEPDNHGYDEIVTAMANFQDDGKRRMLRYADLLKLGCTDKKMQSKQNFNFQWLWRSRLRDYHRHDRAWEYWLGRLTTESCKHIRMIRERHHIGAFQLYDMLGSENACVLTPSSSDILLAKEASASLQKSKAANSPCPASWKAQYREKVWSSVAAAWHMFNNRCDHLVSDLTQQSSSSTKA